MDPPRKKSSRTVRCRGELWHVELLLIWFINVISSFLHLNHNCVYLTLSQMDNKLMTMGGLQSEGGVVSRVQKRAAHAAHWEIPPRTAMSAGTTVWSSGNHLPPTGINNALNALIKKTSIPPPPFLGTLLYLDGRICCHTQDWLSVVWFEYWSHYFGNFFLIPNPLQKTKLNFA